MRTRLALPAALLALPAALLALAACDTRGAGAPPDPQRAQPAPASVLRVRLASYSGDEALEVVHRVDPQRGTVLSRTSTPIARERVVPVREVVRRDDEADGFLRLVERMRAQPALSGEEAQLLAAVEAVAKWIDLGLATTRWSPDGTRVAATAQLAPLVLLDVRDGSGRVLDAERHDLATPFAFSPDSRFLAFAPLDTGVRVVDVASGDLVANRENLSRWVETLCWSPDGRSIAAVGWENRRPSQDPVAGLMAAAGHPVYLNDCVLHVFELAGTAGSTTLLETDVSESGGVSEVEIAWE